MKLDNMNQDKVPSYVYEDLDKIDDDLKCQHLCKKPLEEPLTHKNCNNTFCSACITFRNHECPFCKTGEATEYERITVPIILKLLDKLIVLCCSCQKRLKRGDFKSHIEECPFWCPRNCGEWLSRKTFEAHQQTCDKKLVKCPGAEFGCKEEAERAVLKEHIKECKCESFRVVIEPFQKSMLEQKERFGQKLEQLEDRQKEGFAQLEKRTKEQEESQAKQTERLETQIISLSRQVEELKRQLETTINGLTLQGNSLKHVPARYQWDPNFSGAYYRFDKNVAHYLNGQWPVARVLPEVLPDRKNSILYRMDMGYGWFGLGDEFVRANEFPGYQSDHGFMLCTDGRIWHNNSLNSALGEAHPRKEMTLSVDFYAWKLSISYDDKTVSVNLPQCLKGRKLYFMASVAEPNAKIVLQNLD